MDVRYKHLAQKVQLVLSLVFLIALPFRSAFGQAPKYITLECKSEGFRRTACLAGAPIERIRLTEKKSDAACIEGSSFGFSGDSIWVDKGCAAKFEITFRSPQRDYRGRTETEVASLRCTSEQFSRTNCNAGGTVRSVQLRRQRSQARCEEGTSFGYRNDFIWVDKGCDADFEVSFIPRSAYRQSRRSVRFSCKSNQFKLGACYVAGPIIDLRLVQKKSRAACTKNDSFGFRDDVLWVKSGCEGEFEVTYRPDTRADWEFSNREPQTQPLTCKSNQYRQETCNAGGMISDLRLVKTRSRAQCKANSSYGYDFDQIWVKDGCEADFEVTYYPRP